MEREKIAMEKITSYDVGYDKGYFKAILDTKQLVDNMISSLNHRGYKHGEKTIMELLDVLCKNKEAREYLKRYGGVFVDDGYFKAEKPKGKSKSISKISFVSPTNKV